MSNDEGKSVRTVDERGEPVKLGEYNGMEIYPMPMFATIATPDVRSLAQWYVQVLGFKAVFEAPAIGGQPVVVHLRRKKYQDILIVPGRPGGAGASASAGGMTLSFNADDVDALAAHARSAAEKEGGRIEDPSNTRWNTRDLRVTDPAGNRLVFTAHNENADP
ncbi:MAG TPA: VOC family protein, partial [Terriglobales bacterium]|nr:VOC family protein [Terriglobales bacterium]